MKMGFLEFDFSALFTLTNLLCILLGTFIGILIGAIPGLGPIIAIVLLLPLTFSMSPLSAVLMLLAAFQGAEYGGSISSIVLGIPGTTANIATVFDGHALARNSSPGKALAYSLTASTIGGFIGGLVLLFLSVPVSALALNFSSPEFFLIGVFSLIAVSGISSADKTKSIISGILGLMASTVGMDMFSGQQRFTFGQSALLDGISIIALTVGMFALTEIFSMISEGAGKRQEGNTVNLSTKINWKEIKRIFKPSFTGSGLGAFFGVLPGIASGTASFVAYSTAQKMSKKPETFGKGNPEGIAGPESANNSFVGSSMVPLLTLGIPGSPVIAVIMGAFIIHGIQPGPKLFEIESQLVYGILIGFLFTTVAMYFMGRLLTPMFARILVIPNYILIPIILVLSFVGVYVEKALLFDVWFAIIVGIVFFILKVLDFSLPSFILAFVLGPIMEENLRRALLVSDGSYLIFLTRPYSLAILMLIVITAVFIFFRNKKKEGAA